MAFLMLPDVGSQVTQFTKSDQVAKIDQFSFDGTFASFR